MSLWFPAALAAALVLSSLAGCGPSAPTSGKGGAQPTAPGSAHSGDSAATGKDTKTHDPG
jgi:hypothetical protein